MKDPITGDILDPNSDEFRKEYARQSKHLPKTSSQMNREFDRFVDFLNLNAAAGPGFVEKMLQSQLPDTQVANMLGSFIESRINLQLFADSKLNKPIDLTTTDRVFSQICSVLKYKTNYKIVGNPAWDIAREMKCGYMRDAKKKHGLGELQHQATPLSRAQIDLLLHSDTISLYTPRALISCFYLQLVLYFNPRVRSEAYNITRSELRRIYNPDGTPKCVVYIPQSSLKMDQGTCSSSSTRASRVYKRPAVLPCPSEPKLCMFRILQEMDHHLDLLPFEGDRGTQRMFYGIKTGNKPKDGESFFLKGKMGQDTFDGLLENALWEAGIKTDVKITNQSLRPTAFNLHELLGLSEETMAAVAGHSSSKTNRVYRRQNEELMGRIGGTIQQGAHGTPVTFPNMNIVKMVDGTLRQAKRFLPVIDPVDKNVVHMGLLPLSEHLEEIEVELIAPDAAEE